MWQLNSEKQMLIEQFKKSDYPRGSEWRRWDLHVHTPESKLGDSFSGVSWDDYLTAIEKTAKNAEIAVIGITDYLSIDGYEKILAAKNDIDNPRLSTVALLIPNIELRVLPATTDNKALNIHILVDPTDSQHIEKTKRALRQLRINYDGETYGCCKDELIQFARKQRSDLIDDNAAYKFGIEQFKPSYDMIESWLKKERWLKENCLVGIANGKDGISGLPHDGFAATREQLLKLANFVFSGNPKDREHYLGKKEGHSANDIIQQYNSLKPCLHGSDAHSIETLFKPDKERYCWIKSDPTFEGLKQLLWEPDSRVAIGSVKPQQSDHSRIITELAITSSNGWFVQSSIPLNAGLVAIIGEKGSGKTAVADLVAFTSGASVSRDSQSSFIAKGRLHLENVKTTLVWGAGASTNAKLTNEPFKSQRPLVRYLSQDFVERLCSTDHEGHELQKAIEEVVFAHLDEINREGFSSFAELRASRESASQSQQDSLRGALATAHREIERIIQSLAQRPSKVELKKQVELQIVELMKQLPEVELLADRTVLDKLTKEKEGLIDVERSIAEKSRKKRSIEDILKSYILIKERTTKQIQELVETTKAVSTISEGMKIALYPKWNETIETELKMLSAVLDAEINTLTGSTEGTTPDDNSLASRSLRIKGLQESLSENELNRKRLLDLQKQIGDQEAAVHRLDKEIEELDGKVKNQLENKQTERNEIYKNFFVALAVDGNGLQELYAPMKKQLGALGSEMKFELCSGYRVDSKAWLDKSVRFYDGRKAVASARKDEIEKFVADHLAPAWKTGDKAKISEVFDNFYKLIDPISFMSDLASPSLKLVDLFDWMYSTDHINTSYQILYGGTELEYLSPGTRGIALLVLYLLMDEDDRRPLIIDQPEGNLDNASIYMQLVPYIKKAKEKRQIILVTHNPNLVVATDAEQVIVATAERPNTQSYPRIAYICGSLEHSHNDDFHGIRQAVCTLLEGGQEAFKAREGRYSIRS
jgi:AAA domain, putative AbiEii toxin, Type IV TA system